ncbi:MAG: hypothetical protein AAF316_01025 [Cyanobacteria bacterium P01_A01_bin.80]
MGKSNRKANLLREMKGGKPQKFIKLPPINKKLPKPDDLLPDYGEYLLNSGFDETKPITISIENYMIVQDAPQEWQLQGVIGDAYVFSILTNLEQGRQIKRDNSHCFECRLSPKDEFKDQWGNRIIPLRLVKILD